MRRYIQIHHIVLLLLITILVCNASKMIQRKGMIPSLSSSPSSSTSSDDVTTSQIFSLDSIRSTLIRQEETIIFSLIERAQYRKNAIIYDENSSMSLVKHTDDGTAKQLSFLQWMLIETENLHSKVRRYTSPEEHPFFPSYLSEEPLLPPLSFPQILVSTKGDVDVNKDIYNWYIDIMIDRLCVDGDDEQHGSSVLCDIQVMQALSRRIHYGKFVAESKFLSNPNAYGKLIKEGNTTAILELLTNVEVERRVLRRAFVKASTYGQDLSGLTEGYKIDPMLIADIYRDMIIPLTKDVEIRYLYHRIGQKPPPSSAYIAQCRGPLDAFEDPNWLSQLAPKNKPK